MGCEVGEGQTFQGSGGGGGGGGTGGGGGGGGGVDAAPAAVGDPDAAWVDCDPPVTQNLNSGNHNPGMSCITAGCHDGGTAGAPRWYAAGTIYRAGAALPGATIHLIDGAGNDLPLISSLNGNFYTDQPVTFPVTAKASRCPDSAQMPDQVQTADASCNQGGCHDANQRMTLP